MTTKLYPLLLLAGALQGQTPQTRSALGPDTPAQMQLVVPQCSINGGKMFPARADGMCYAPKPVAPVEAQIKTVCDAASAKIAAIQKAHPEIQIELSCGVYETTMDSATDQKKTYPLTLHEIDELDYRRAASTVAFHNEDALVKRIIAAHGVQVPEYNDPCWHFVGIILGDHFITEEFPAPQYAAKHGCYAGAKP